MNKSHAQQSRNNVTSVLTCSYVVVFFLAFVSRQDSSDGDKGQEGHSFISHPRSAHIHLPCSSFILTLTGVSCSVSLSEERDGGRMSGMRVRRGWVKGNKKWTRIDSSVVRWANSHSRSSYPAPLNPVKEQEVFNFVSLIFTSHYNCILLMVCSWHVLPPPWCFPLSFCPSLTPPPQGLPQWVGSTLSVC